jgi:hypothetical protein
MAVDSKSRKLTSLKESNFKRFMINYMGIGVDGEIGTGKYYGLANSNYRF